LAYGSRSSSSLPGARESGAAYAGAGTVAGALLPVAVLVAVGASDGWWEALFGAMGGAVTGTTWWRSARRDAATHA
jgi:membrane associated rhomboid family serine protease